MPRIDIGQQDDYAQANGLDLPIVAINLARRPDRWQTLSRRMGEVGFDKLIRASAVDGALLTTEEIATFLGTSADHIDDAPPSHLSLTRSAVGCFMSHLAVWRWVIESGLPRVLIFEDDAAPMADFDAARFGAVIASLPEDAGLVFAGVRIMAGLAEKPTDADLARIYYLNGLFAYLVTPAACATLSEYLTPPKQHIDHQISHVLIEQRATFSATYSVHPFFDSDWSLGSDNVVPMADEPAADRDLGLLVESSKRLLLSEGRPLQATAD